MSEFAFAVHTCPNYLPLRSHAHLHTLVECSSSLVNGSNYNGHVKEHALNPLIINGDPPTFLSAPERRIIASSPLCLDFCSNKLCSTVQKFNSFINYTRKSTCGGDLNRLFLDVCAVLLGIFTETLSKQGVSSSRRYRRL